MALWLNETVFILNNADHLWCERYGGERYGCTIGIRGFKTTGIYAIFVIIAFEQWAVLHCSCLLHNMLWYSEIFFKDNCCSEVYNSLLIKYHNVNNFFILGSSTKDHFNSGK